MPAATQHQSQVATLSDKISERIVAGQGQTRAPRFQNRVRVHQRHMPGIGNRNANETIRTADDETSEQHRADVVAVTPAAGDGFAL